MSRQMRENLCELLGLEEPTASVVLSQQRNVRSQSDATGLLRQTEDPLQGLKLAVDRRVAEVLHANHLPLRLAVFRRDVAFAPNALGLSMRDVSGDISGSDRDQSPLT